MPFIGSPDRVTWSCNHYKYLCKPIQMIGICFVFPEFKVVLSTFVQLCKNILPKIQADPEIYPFFHHKAWNRTLQVPFPPHPTTAKPSAIFLICQNHP
jgi:hypothetical protein